MIGLIELCMHVHTCTYTYMLESKMCVCWYTNLLVGISRMMSTGSWGEQREKKSQRRRQERNRGRRT